MDYWQFNDYELIYLIREHGEKAYKILYEKNVQDADPDNNKKKRITYTYSLDFNVGDLEVPLAIVYPFTSVNHGSPKEYVVEGFARVFFTADSGNAWDKGLRTSISDMSLGDNFDWSGDRVKDTPSGEEESAFIQLKSP